MSIIEQTTNIPTIIAGSASVATQITLPTANGKISLNGYMVSPSTGQVSFIDKGYASCIDIVSGQNITANTFTIVGTFNGNIITESITGPSAGFANSNNLFHTIISITMSGNAIGTIDINSNNRVAVMLIGDNPIAEKLSKSNLYNVSFNSRAATAGLSANNVVIYGIANAVPTSLQQSNFASANIAPNNFYSLFSGTMTKAILNTGNIYSTNYPFAAIIVYIATGINATPYFVEITQS